MDNFILGLILGLFIGAFLGIFLISCLVAGRDSNREIDYSKIEDED